MVRYCAAFCLALAASPAMAEGYFQVEAAPWFIFGTDEKCTALNRPPAEFNQAPYNALQIRMDSARQPEVSVYFWPDAVPATISQLALSIQPNDAMLLKAKLVVSDIGMVTVTEPLPKDFIRSLETAASFTILQTEVPDSKSKTAFDISDMQRVMMHLQTCVGVLERSKNK